MLRWPPSGDFGALAGQSCGWIDLITFEQFIHIRYPHLRGATFGIRDECSLLLLSCV